MNGASTVLSGVFAGRYSIERELGRGGSAIVYLARDQQRGQAVAIKVLRPELAESVGADRFLKEIRLTESLQHPHILSVLDTGMHENRPYFVLPYMEGGTLRHRLEQEKQLALDEVLSITRAVAESLAHAHAKGFIHRDVKPENILFTAGRACLADFGIARALERSIDDATTSTSLVRGTPLYMSPEQATGQRALDARTDVYSLASVVYELLAGVPPFVGPTPESVLAQKATRAPQPVRNYRPTVPIAVDSAIARGLMLTPADRFKDPMELVDALEQGARTPDLDSNASTWSSRRRATYGTIALLGIAGALVAFQLLKPESAAPREMDPRRLAVLYFDDLTPDNRLGHIAAGLTENLIDQLSQVPQLRVASPNAVRRFRNRDAPIDSMARALDAGTLIAGSVSRVGAQLRVSVRMIDPMTGAQVNSRTLEQPSWEFFRLQDSISLDVSYWLRERLGAQIRLRERRAASASVAAWELLHKAEALARDARDRDIAGDTSSARLFRLADSILATAEGMNQRWVEPTIRRAQVASNRAFAFVDEAGRPTDGFALQLRTAIAHADRALRADPNSADALIARAEARARLVAWLGAQPAESLMTASETDLRRAVALRPDRARAWYALGEVQFWHIRFEDALDALKTAYAADPFLENVRSVMNFLVMSAIYANRIEEARHWCALGVNRFPDDPRFRGCALSVLGASGRTNADADAAWRMVSEIERSDTAGLHAVTWSYRRAMVAAILARGGMRDSARAVLVRARRDRGERPAADKEEAYVRLLLGDRGEAIALLRIVLAESPNERLWVSRMSWYESLHRDAQFRKMTGLP